MDCPNGVNIPKVFKTYNEYVRNKNLGETKKIYFSDMDESCRGSSCISCGVCLEKCPQHINIPEKLAMAHKVLSEL